MLVIYSKKDFEAKVLDIASKYITSADYNKFTEDIVANKIKSEGLVNKSTFTRFINKTDLDEKKVATLAGKAELKSNKIPINKITSVWFKLISWKKLFWRWWYSKLFSFPGNVQMF